MNSIIIITITIIIITTIIITIIIIIIIILIYCSLNISYVVSVSLFYFCYIGFLLLYLVDDFKFW